MEIDTTCRSCGNEWRPSHADYVRGTWRICVTCRDRQQDATASDTTPTACRDGPDAPGPDDLQPLAEAREARKTIQGDTKP